MRRPRWWIARNSQGCSRQCRLVEAEECLPGGVLDGCAADRAGVADCAQAAVDPLKTLAESGYVEKVTSERSSRNAKSASSYA